MSSSALERLAEEIRACRYCLETPRGRPLPHAPRPVLRVSSSARICIAGQAPGTRVHASGKPFTDPSGDRLRAWMGVTEAEFYDSSRIAIVPMGFCFPGLDAKGGDLPPRKECAPLWRARLFDELPALDLLLLVGGYAQSWHLSGHSSGHPRQKVRSSLTETVAAWAEFAAPAQGPTIFPLPHPSWRNNGWLKRNDWFERDLLPQLRLAVQQCLSGTAREL